MILPDIFSALIVTFACFGGFRIGMRRSFTRLGCLFIFAFAGFLLSDIIASCLYNSDFSFLNIKIQGLRLRTFPGLLRALVAVNFPEYSAYVNDAYFLNLTILKFSKAILKIPCFLLWMLLSVPIIDGLFFKKMFQGSQEKISEKIMAAAVGCIHGLVLLMFVLSPLNGINQIKSTLENEPVRNNGHVAMSLSGNSVFDGLFKTHYKNEGVAFRKDLESIMSLREASDPGILLTVLEKAEATELLAPAIIEIFLLSKDTAVNEKLIKELKAVSYRKEIPRLNNAYKLFRGLDFDEFPEIDGSIIKAIADELNACKIIDILFPHLIFDFFPELSEYIKADINGIAWTREIQIYTRIYELLEPIERTFDEFMKCSEEDVLEALDLLFSSDLYKRNEEIIIELFMENILPENLRNLEFTAIKESEITNAYLFASFLYKHGFFSKEFTYTNFLTDENIERIITHICESDLLVKNIDKILPILFSKSSLNINVIILPALDWKSSEGRAELRRFFEFLRLFSNNQKHKKEVLFYTESFLRKKEISSLVYLNGDKIISHFIAGFFGKGFSLSHSVAWDSEEGRNEIMNLVRIYREFARTDLIYAKSLKKISDKNLTSIGNVLHESALFRKNFNEILKSLLRNLSLGWELECEFDEPTEEEVVRLLFALKAMSEIKTEADIFKLNSKEIDAALSSNTIVEVLKQYLHDLERDGHLCINIDESEWKEELRNFLFALKRLSEKKQNFGMKNFDLNIIHFLTTGNEGEESNDLSLILKSKILTDTIISKIKDLEKNRNTGEGIFIINVRDEDWIDDSSDRPGELRNFVRGIQIIYRKLNIDLNNPAIHREKLKEISAGTEDTNGDGVIDDNDDNELREIIKSKILADTIIFLLYEEVIKS